MGDEAFARRFYADRTELQGLGVPIASVRDEFTSEELYSLREEHYFLPSVDLTDAELAALQTSFYLLEGQFAYAEPLRLALQNLALGRAWPAADPGPKTATVELLGPSYTAEVAQRLAKLEQAISRQRTVRFRYWTITSDSEAERTVNPYGLFELNGVWYMVGDDLDRPEGPDRRRTFRVSRIRGEIKFATRRERDFRMPADFNVTAYRDRAPWRLVAEEAGTAILAVAADASWLVERRYGAYGEFEELDDGSGRFTTAYSEICAAVCLDPVARRPGGARRARRAGRRRRGRPAGARRGARGPGAHAVAHGRAGAAGRAGPAAAWAERRRARALRAAAGAARLPARRLRRGLHRPGADGRARRALPAQPAGAEGAPRAAEPGQLRRRLLRGLLLDRERRRSSSTRSSTATPSAARPGSRRSRRRPCCGRSTWSRRWSRPRPTASLETVREKVEAAFGRFPLAGHADAAGGGRRGAGRHDAERGRAQPPAGRHHLPVAVVGRALHAHHRALSAAPRRSRLVRRGLRSQPRRPAHVQGRLHQGRAAAPGALRAATEMADLDHALGGDVGVARVRFSRRARPVGARGPAGHAGARPTAPRWSPSPTAPATG